MTDFKTDFKFIPLKEIRPDENQPRKIYDDIAMAELTQSVQEQGILQPILVRPNGKGFLLVCGERRYRAAKSAGLSQIPAVIRELTDDQALELQIIENLQRKDIHPMEEAIAFKSLIEKKEWQVSEVATRVGKTDQFVRQRLKLNELSKDWQQAFYINAVSLTLALELAMLPLSDQMAIYKSKDVKERLKDPGCRIDINDWEFRSYKGKLSKAPFDLADATLNKKMGACTGCPFNTAVASLFPEKSGEAKCMNHTCFKGKSDTSFERRLKESVQDPAMVFINTEYGDYKEEREKLQKDHGIEVFGYGTFNQLEAPEAPEYQQFCDDKREEYDTEKEFQAAWKKQQQYYDDELKEFEEKMASGKYKKALVVIGSKKGLYIYISFRKSSKPGSNGKTAKQRQEAIKEGKASLTDIKSEINRIEENLVKAAELDSEKVHLKIMEDYTKHPLVIEKPDKALNSSEWIALRWFILNEAGCIDGYGVTDEITEILGFDDMDLSDKDTRETLWARIGELTEKEFALVFRHLMQDKYGKASPRGYSRDEAFVMRKMAESLTGIPIDEYEEEQKVIADKRQKTADKRLADLKKLEEEKAAKKGAKKTTPSKVRGKKASLADDDE